MHKKNIYTRYQSLDIYTYPSGHHLAHCLDLQTGKKKSK